MNETYMFIITELDFYQEGPLILQELITQKRITDKNVIHIFIDEESYMKQVLSAFQFHIEDYLLHPIKEFYDIVKETDSEKISIIISSHGNEKTGIVYSELDFSPEKLFSELEKTEEKKDINIYFSQCFAGLYDISLHNKKNNYTLLGACNSFQKATMIPYLYMFLLDQIEDGTNIEQIMKDAGVDLEKDPSPIKILCSIFLHTVFKNLDFISDLKKIDSKYQDYIKQFNLFLLKQIVCIKKNHLLTTASEEQKKEEIFRLDSLLIKDDIHLWIKIL